MARDFRDQCKFLGEPVGCWRPVVHKALDGDSALFSHSDRAVQEKIGVWLKALWERLAA